VCGISGFWAPGKSADAATAILKGMADRIAHRGPDDSGLWYDDTTGVGMGHRRLAIVDLSEAGRQPMRSASRRFTMVFNGEIYNHRSLRAELVSLGARFRGHSDTEVLLEGFDRWGVGHMLERTAGMFAAALWDAKEHALALFRDRLGEKPLYYGTINGALVFGSELKALRVYPDWNPSIDIGALTAFTRFAYVPAPLSIYSGVAKVEPATILWFTTSGGPPRRQVYWSLREQLIRGRANRLEGDDAALINALDSVLRRTIGEEMVSDVPLGAFLSGGIDSSSVVALMQAQSPVPVRTFTIAFHEQAFNEADFAREVAAHLGTQHTELYVTAEEARDTIPLLPSMYDEPFADSSQIPTFLVSRLARQHVTVSLSGDGGDEVFGGYNRYLWGRSLWSSFGWISPDVRRLCGDAIMAIPPSVYDQIGGGLCRILPRRLRPPAPGDRVHKFARVFSSRSAGDLYGQLVSQWLDPKQVVLDGHEPQTRFAHATRDATGDFVSRMMYIDAMTYLPDDIMVKVDRAAMAVSLESRAPFLDHRVVEFAARLPERVKVRKRTGKWILRELLARHVPRRLIERPKMGFGVPLDRWLRGPLREWAEHLLDSSRLRQQGYFDGRRIENLWSEHVSGRRNWQYPLWTILMFQAWLEAEGGAIRDSPTSADRARRSAAA
jgi:asparagine synthase (glutamine-hydrolysing)